MPRLLAQPAASATGRELACPYLPARAPLPPAIELEAPVCPRLLAGAAGGGEQAAEDRRWALRVPRERDGARRGIGERDVGDVRSRVEARGGGRGEGDGTAERDGGELLVEAPDLDAARRRVAAHVVGRVERPPDRVRTGVRYDRLVPQLVDGDRRAPRQRVGARQHRDAGFGEQVLEGVLAVDRPAHERYIRRGAGEAGRRVVVVGQAQADLQLRLGGLQVGEDRRRQLRGGEHRVANPQGRGAGGATGLLDRGRGLREDATRGGEQRLSGRGQPQ